MSIYQFNKDQLPDQEYESGAYIHLVKGNQGRLLDPRRTPVQIVNIDLSQGLFVIEILAFEDKNAHWKIPFEEIERYQFKKGEKRAADKTLKEIQQAVERFDRPLHIPCDPTNRSSALDELKIIKSELIQWFHDYSQFFRADGDLPDPHSRMGDPLLWDDLQRFMAEKNLLELEETFASQFVSNPGSGELVKGHRIVLAELGLVPFQGKVIRDEALFNGIWSKERRKEHILHRLAFTQSIFKRLGYERVCLYRAMSSSKEIQPPRNTGFVSATMSAKVAQSHFEAGKDEGFGALYRQWVPVKRLFMSFYETEQMNRSYQEAEAVLLYEANNLIF
jgi:hypothetical protein